MNRGPDQCNGVLKYFKPIEDVVMNWYFIAVATVFFIYNVKLTLIVMKLNVFELYLWSGRIKKLWVICILHIIDVRWA